MTPLRGAILIAALFLAASLSLSEVRPLWLDEILQLIDTTQPSPTELIARLPGHHSGSAPLGYLVQQATLKITGYSVRNARLAEGIFGAAAVFTVALLAAELGLKWSWLSAALFAMFPIVLRYATEARMYSQALFFSVLATLIYVRLAKRPSWSTAAAYGLAIAAAAYTQPYAASVGLAHILWSLIHRERKTALLGGAAFALALAAFVPWYLWAKASWVADIAHGGLRFSASAKTPLMLFRELAGVGYWGSGLILLMCAAGVAGLRGAPRTRTLLALLIAVPTISIVAADAWFDYFLAARQFIWVLPAVAMFAAASVEWRPRVGFALAVILALLCVRYGILFFTSPREDWHAAANAIEEQVRFGACVTVAPAESTALYEFFRPELRSARCVAPRMLLVITPYATSDQRQAAVAALTAEHFRQESESVVGKSRIILFRRLR
jgi:hypothetical protein